MQSLKSPYILYNQQSMGSTLHNNLLFITDSAFLACYCDYFTHNFPSAYFVPLSTSAYTRKYFFVPLFGNGCEISKRAILLSLSNIFLNHLISLVVPCNLIFNMFHLTFRNTLDNEVESPARNMAHTHNKTDPLPYNAHTLLIYLLHLPFHIQSVCHCSKD